MKPSNTLRRIPLVAERLLAMSFVILLLWALYFALSNSAIEWPFEYREFAPVSFTGALLDGINPYALESEPYFTNLYGPLYNLLVWPFAALVGNGFKVHRLVSLFFLGAGATLLYSLIRRGRGGGALALCAAALFFLAQLDDVAGLARPDALGVFLFLAALAVLVRSPACGPIALGSSALLAVLAFFAKPYFALAAPIGAAFLLLRRRPAALFRYGAFGLGWLALLAFAAYQLWPTVFVNTLYVLAKGGIDQHSWAHLREQGVAFVRANLGLIVALGAASLRWLVARGRASASGARDVAAADLRAIGGIGLVAGSAAMVGVLGANSGNGQLYYTQLVLPFLLILVPPTARGSRSGRALASLAFLYALLILLDFTAVKIGGREWPAVCPPCAALSSLSPYQYGSPVFDVGEENRRTRARVRDLIAETRGEVFGGPESSALLQELQGRFYDNGLSEYCSHASDGEGPLLRAYGDRCRSHWKRIRQQLRKREFARVLLVVDSRYISMLRGHYRLTASYPIRLGYNRKQLGVFEPLPR